MKIIAYAAISLIFLSVGFYLFNNFIYQEKQEPNSKLEPYSAILSGEQVCLPHKIQNGSTTDECAFGLLTETGEYYALDLAQMTGQHQVIMPGDRITAEGIVTPAANLSTGQWEKYVIDGLFSVTTSLEVTSPAATIVE